MQFSLFTKTVCGFFAALFLFYVATMTLAPVRPSDFEWGVSTLGLPIFELTFFCLITLTIWKLRSTWLRYPVGIVCFLIPALIGTFYAIQMISVILTGKYITVLALENTSEISYVVNKTSVSITVGLLCLCLALAWAAFSGVRRRGPNKAVGISMTIGVILILALGAVYSERKNIISTAVESRFAPAIGLVETYQLKQASPPSNLARIVKFVLRVENGDTIPLYEVDVTADFPYQHDGSSHGELPFTIDRNSGEPMNIIIIFMEGISARVLASHGGPYTDLAPNLDRFAESSIVIDGYFNHTAASYRGIQGGLASAFPYAGGIGAWDLADNGGLVARSTTYATLPKIFGNLGYDTRFFSPLGRSDPFHGFLEHLGFAEVNTFEDVPKYEPISEALVDKDFFASMVDAMQEREQSGDDSPFFWSAYNWGSHAFLDSPADATKYGDGSNAALNRFLELDTSIEIFIEAFEASSFADNTILILTSDHSSYAEPPTVEAFAGSPNYTDNFIDEIPFMIRIPGVEQAARYENGIRTSIDLAPTVLHLMGLSDVDHAFVGTSVFDPSVQPERNVAATGQDIYRIDSNGVTYITDETEIPEDEILIDTVYHYYQLEVENRVFGDSQTAAEATD